MNPTRAGLEGPRFEPLLSVGSYPAEVLASTPAAADGRDWKYFGIGLPFLSTNACPIRLEPTFLPPRCTREPLALSCKPGICATPLTSSPYPTPSASVDRIIHGSAGMNWRRISHAHMSELT